jgi:hypothetical protein
MDSIMEWNHEKGKGEGAAKNQLNTDQRHSNKSDTRPFDNGRLKNPGRPPGVEGPPDMNEMTKEIKLVRPQYGFPTL